MNEIVGLALGLGIGATCRWFDIPAPAPPRIAGALLVVAMTLGFLSTDAFLTRETPESASVIAGCDQGQGSNSRKQAC